MAKKPQTSTELQPSGKTAGLVAAFQDVTDGVLDLAKTHLELAKAEARHDLKVFGNDAFRAAVGIAFALLGFGILNLAVICLAGWFGGIGAMAATGGVLGSVYIIAGLRVAYYAAQRMKEREGALNNTKSEIKRSSQWVKEMRESS